MSNSNLICVWVYRTSDSVYEACQKVGCVNDQYINNYIEGLKDSGYNTFTSVNSCVNDWNSNKNNKPLYIVYQPLSDGNCSPVALYENTSSSYYPTLQKCLQNASKDIPETTTNNGKYVSCYSNQGKYIC